MPSQELPPPLSEERIEDIAARIGSLSLHATRLHQIGGPTRTIFDPPGLVEFVRAIESEVRAAVVPAVQPGWRLVPKEPTEAMIDAGCDTDAAARVVERFRKRHPRLPEQAPAGEVVREMYRAMLDVAPGSLPAVVQQEVRMLREALSLAIDFIESVHDGEYGHEMRRDDVADMFKALLSTGGDHAR